MTITADSVRALEKSRIQAMLASDIAALRDLISPDCSYVHTTGRLDTGESYLRNLAGGGFRYEELTAAESTVTLHGAAAVIVFRQSARIVIGTRPTTSVSRCTAVWAEEHGSTRMIAFQATSADEPATTVNGRNQ
jgi:hypothetical protein